MATDLYYNADPMLEGAVVHGAGRGQLLAQRQRELEELDRFNQDQALKRELQQQSLQYQAQQDSDRMAMQSAQIGAQLYSNEQDWMGRAALEQMNQQGQMNYAAAQGAAQAQAYGAQGAAQYARDLQNARLEKAMSEHDSIQKAWEEGELFTSDEQLQQAQAAWEAKYPELGGWGLPDRIAQEQATTVTDQRLASLESAFKSPITGQPMMGRDELQALMEAGAEVKDLLTLLPKMRSDEIDRKKLDIDAQASEKKLIEQQEKDEQKQVADQQKSAVKQMRDSIGGEREYYQAIEQHRADLKDYENQVAAWQEKVDVQEQQHQAELAAHQEAMKGYEFEKEAHADMAKMQAGTQKAAGGSKPKPFAKAPPAPPVKKPPPPQPRPPVAPSPGMFADKIPMASSPEEVQQRIESGEWLSGTRFITPDGRIKVVP